MKLWVAMWHVKSNGIGLPQKKIKIWWLTRPSLPSTKSTGCHMSSQNRGDADSDMLFSLHTNHIHFVGPFYLSGI